MPTIFKHFYGSSKEACTYENKYIRANQSGFMNKNLRKAMMERSRLRNIFLKKKTKESKKSYNKQRNYCVNLLRKTRFLVANLNINKITDNKKFWKIVKPLLSDKLILKDVIDLAKDGKMLDSDNKVDENLATIFYYS